MAENFNTNHVSRSFGRGFGRGRGKDTRQKHNMPSDNNHQFSSSTSTSVDHDKQYEDRQNDSDSGIVKIEKNFVGRIIGMFLFHSSFTGLLLFLKFIFKKSQ